MARSGGGTSTGLIQDLLENPQEFEFFQAVRLIELYVSQEKNHPRSDQVGGDRGPHHEPIRFRTLPSLAFPPGQISQLVPTKSPQQEDESNLPLEMTVAFMGLTGPNGVLPQHYTSLLIERSHQKNKDHTLREFFDLFNHRLIGMFYRAWEKYRFPFAYERNLREGEFDDDLFTKCLFSLVGLQETGLRDRFTFDDEAIVSYGGLMAQRCRNAIGLEEILSNYFQVTARVLQFQGQWLNLPEDTQSSFPSEKHRNGLNLSLGETAVVGSRVWDVQSRVRIQLGSLTIGQFNSLLPGSPQLTSVAELIRFYVGPEKDFDVQLVLRKEDIPPCRLAADSQYTPRLGWNTWMQSERSSHDAMDAVFQFHAFDSL
jgi:type VI secretion system protein ImpH